MTALVIGSITPDFEYFFRMEQNSYYSHTWGGIFWFDLPLGLLLVYLFNYLIKNDLIENLPKFFNRRFSRFTYFKRNLNSKKDFLFILISLLIGITSHIIWDRLTHKSVRLIDQEEHYTVFWEANSLVGAFLIASVIWKMPAGKNTQKSNIFFYWLIISVITIAVVYIRNMNTSHLRELGISVIVGFFTGLIVTSIVEKLKKSSSMPILLKRKMIYQESKELEEEQKFNA